MRIRNAILKAADHIERNPGEFDFGSGSSPEPGCGTKTCALGWIGSFLGNRCDASGYARAARAIGAASDYDFYQRMTNIEHGDTVHAWADADWPYDPALCAATLRKYADKYHPAEKKPLPGTGIPADVLAIFNAPRHELLAALDGKGGEG